MKWIYILVEVNCMTFSVYDLIFAVAMDRNGTGNYCLFYDFY